MMYLEGEACNIILILCRQKITELYFINYSSESKPNYMPAPPQRTSLSTIYLCKKLDRQETVLASR